MTKIAAVVGPTATGKTALAIALAQRRNGEIISCDSMQIYRGMDIGTAKPNAVERAQAVHHMIDVASPEEQYSCVQYVASAKQCVEEIAARGRIPIFCGGTGLYLDSVLYGTDFSEGEADPAYRASLALLSPEVLHAKLCEIDPSAAAAVHPHNVKRVIRALEIYHTTGKTKTEWDAASRSTPPSYDAVVIGLDYRDRTRLYARIDRRVDEMMAQGLLAEVSALQIPPGSTAAQAIGYKELLAAQRGECTVAEAVERIKTASRNYAKRQLTWFRRNKQVHWFFRDELTFEEIVNNAVSLLT